MTQNQDQEQTQVVQDTSSGTPRNRLNCLIQNMEQVVLNTQKMSKPELISALQNFYAECLEIAQHLANDSINAPIPEKTPKAELIQSLRQVILDQRVAELGSQGWYLEPIDRKLDGGGTSTIWRMRRWQREKGKRETKYVGVVVSGRRPRQ